MSSRAVGAARQNLSALGKRTGGKVKERPILMSGPMVRAILDGRKTQTRRVMKVQPNVVERWLGGSPTTDQGARFAVMRDGSGQGWACCGPFTCPYGAVGDRLWVRETWKPVMHQWSSGIEYAAGGFIEANLGEEWVAPPFALRFPGARKDMHSERWRPSIHMPRWASRITLTISDVRVHRLQDITDEDAKAEGVGAGPPAPAPDWWAGKTDRDVWWTARDSFRLLWDSINGEGAWDANPWVWVITFTVNK